MPRGGLASPIRKRVKARVHITGSSAGLELVKGAVIVYRSKLARRWLPAKSQLCRKWVEEGLDEVTHEGARHRLPLPMSTEPESFPQWELYWASIMRVFKNPSRSAESMALAREKGVSWHGSLDQEVLAVQGFVTLPLLMPESVRKAGHEVMEKTRQSMENRERAVNHPGLGNARVLTSRPVSRAVYRAIPGADKFSHHPFDVGSAEAAFLDSLIGFAADGIGLSASSMSVVEYHFATSKDAAEMGQWHGDDPHQCSLAVWVSMSDEGDVPPFFVRLSASEVKDGMTPPQARLLRWTKVLRSGKNTGVSVPAVSPSGALMAETSKGTRARTRAPANAHGEQTAYNNKGGCKRAKCAPGTAVAFDGTSPHRAPGVGDGEGSRWIIYIGFQSTKTHLNGLAPVLAHAPADKNAAHERVWDEDGFRLESATGRKRPRTVSG
jgi:hypothetical protein